LPAGKKTLIEWLVKRGHRITCPIAYQKGDHMRNKYLNLGLVFCIVFGSLLTVYPAYAYDDFPPTGFWNDPPDPSIFDVITFGLDGSPSPEWQCLWNFGDGTTVSHQCWEPLHKQYQNDGDYTVSVAVTFGDDTVNLIRVVSVRTHDIAIAKFTVPQSARVGQTRQIGVYVRNNRYPENVQVELYKSTVNGYAWVGTLTQYTPVRPANRTTTFGFNYTFTAEDAYNGKVTFRAMAFILDARDALQADNEAISLPTRVSR
jgi:hypothetical protein